MRKRKRFSAILMGVAVVGLSAYVGYRTYDAYVEKQVESDLVLENIEALAQEDEVAMQDCTRAVVMGACIADDGENWDFRGTYVSSVEHYQVPVGSVAVCLHESVRSCPPGSHPQ